MLVIDTRCPVSFFGIAMSANRFLLLPVCFWSNLQSLTLLLQLQCPCAIRKQRHEHKCNDLIQKRELRSAHVKQ